MAQEMTVSPEGLLYVESVLSKFLLNFFLYLEKVLPVGLLNQRQAGKMREEGETTDDVFVLEGHELIVFCFRSMIIVRI
jgi:hypothetical protein